MATEHGNWRECGDLYALGALDGKELKTFQAHLATDCPTCDAYVYDTRETLNLLHRSLRPMTPPSDVKVRIIDQIENDATVAVAAKAPARAHLWRRMTGTIAAGIIGLLIGGAYYRFQYEPRHSLYTSVINLLRDPATRDHSLYGAGPAPQAKGRFLWNQSGEGHIFVSNLPAAPAGKMYAVWTIARSSAPSYVGTITTDAMGQGGLHINTPSSELPVETFAVTLEPAGSTAKPMGPMVLVSKPS